MKKFAIILAGGEGKRAGGDIPKQFVSLDGKPIVWWSMKAFKEADPDTVIILVMHPGFFDDWEIIVDNMPEEDYIPCILSCGGLSRAHSVYNGLLSIKDYLEEKYIAEEEAVVAIHDGARPLVSRQMILRGFNSLEHSVGVIPGVRCTNSLRKVEEPDRVFDGSRSVSVDRSEYVEVQTPQIFSLPDIFSAYIMKEENRDKFTDDASLAESIGLGIKLYEGESTNIKVTHPEDFKIAEILLRGMVK